MAPPREEETYVLRALGGNGFSLGRPQHEKRQAGVFGRSCWTALLKVGTWLALT
jgi:hypothetical protein